MKKGEPMHFRREHFTKSPEEMITGEMAAEFAEMRFVELTDSWPKVSGRFEDGWWFAQQANFADTHEARLALIKPLEEQRCKHTKFKVIENTPEGEIAPNSFVCLNCKKQLYATMRAVE